MCGDFCNMEKFMKIAIKEAMKSSVSGDVPVGVVIVKNGKIIAKAHNEKMKKHSPTRHAEIIAIEKACKKIGDYRLEGCDMIVTKEPCLMCYGAILSARIRNVCFGAYDKKYSVLELKNMIKFNHETNMVGGVLEEECAKILTEFFSDLRNEKCKH